MCFIFCARSCETDFLISIYVAECDIQSTCVMCPPYLNANPQHPRWLKNRSQQLVTVDKEQHQLFVSWCLPSAITYYLHNVAVFGFASLAKVQNFKFTKIIKFSRNLFFSQSRTARKTIYSSLQQRIEILALCCYLCTYT
jgi:hypothetical protein